MRPMWRPSAVRPSHSTLSWARTPSARWREVGCEVRVGNHAEATGISVWAVNKRHQRATFFHPGTTVGMPAFPAREDAPGLVLVCGWPHPPLKTLAAKFRAVQRRGTFTAMD